MTEKRVVKSPDQEYPTGQEYPAVQNYPAVQGYPNMHNPNLKPPMVKVEGV